MRMNVKDVDPGIHVLDNTKTNKRTDGWTEVNGYSPRLFGLGLITTI